MSTISLGIVCRNLMRNYFQLRKNAIYAEQLTFCLHRRTYTTEKSFESPANENANQTNRRFNIKSVAAAVIAAGAMYKLFDYMESKEEQLNYMQPDVVTIERLPKVLVNRKIVHPNDKTNLDLMLLQCQTCPFCCKMIAYLDSKGFSYSVVDVDVPFERRLKWSYHKTAPCVLARTKQGNYIELTNSSVIISILAAISNDPEIDIEELAKLYPKIAYIKPNGLKKHGIVNKYELKYQKLPKGVTADAMSEEYRWRDWADHQFIHMIYPNIYGTHSEALETYHWFAKMAKWDEIYPSFIKYLLIHTGAVYMFLISKRLKKRHRLSDNVRDEFYKVCDRWTYELEKLKTQFHGGNQPDLADLAVFGAINSMEGCQTFRDIMDNTKIEPWFIAMKENVEKNKGKVVMSGEMDGPGRFGSDPTRKVKLRIENFVIPKMIKNKSNLSHRSRVTNKGTHYECSFYRVSC